MHHSSQSFSAFVILSFYIAFLEVLSALFSDLLPVWVHWYCGVLILLPLVLISIVRSIRSIRAYNQGD